MSNKKVLSIAIILMTIIVAIVARNKMITTVYKKFSSPDKQYEIIVYRKASLFGSIGGSGDSPGIVCLVDKQGKVLQKKQVEIVQQIDTVRWKDKRVEIKLFAEWELR